MANMYDFTKVSKKTVDNDVRIENQINESLDKYYKEQKALSEAEETRKNEAAMSAARFTYASTASRSNERVRALAETIKYNETASIHGMTEMVSEIVEKALLLDEEELLKIQPEYKRDIRDIVCKLLSEGDVNEDITNPDTLAIMEYVARTLPDAKDGRYLTEDELQNLISSQRPADMDEALAKFSGDVSHKVATLMEKEQKRIKEVAAEQPAAPVEQAQEEAPVESAPEAAAEQQVEEQQPVEGEVPAEEQAPVEGEVPVEGGEVASQEPFPRKQVQLLPDGTMNINIFEALDQSDDEADYQYLSEAMKFDVDKASEKYATKAYTAKGKGIGAATGAGAGALLGLSAGVVGAAPGALIGLILGHGIAKGKHSEDITRLADNVKHDSKAMDIASKIKEAIDNKDKASFKALKKQFISRVKEMKKEAVLSKGSEKKALAEFVRETPRSGLIESLSVNEASNMLTRGEEYNPDLCLAKAIEYVTIMEALDSLGLIDVDDEKYAKVICGAGGKVCKEKGKCCGKTLDKKVDVEPFIFTESCTTQWKPAKNPETTDFAERIRQKKLLQEQSSHTLNE